MSAPLEGGFALGSAMPELGKGKGKFKMGPTQPIEPLLEPKAVVQSNGMDFTYVSGLAKRSQFPDDVFNSRDSDAKAKPIRMPAYAQLNINSIDRYADKNQPVSEFAPILLPSIPNYSQPNSGPGQIANNFTTSLQRPILNGYFTRLAVTEVNFDWNVPNIMRGFNDKIYLAVPGFSTIQTYLAPGYYNGVRLAQNISTVVNAALSNASYPFINVAASTTSGFDCAYNPTFQALTVQFNNASTLNTGFAFTTTTSSIVGEEKNRVLTTYNTLGITYPNTQSTNVFVNQAGNLVSTFNTGFQCTPYKAPYTEYVDIISKRLSQFMKVKDSETSQTPDTDVLCRVYTVPPNTVDVPDLSGNRLGTRPYRFTFDPNTAKSFKWSPNEAIFDFDISVRDMYGNLLPWSEQYPWEFNMTLLASET